MSKNGALIITTAVMLAAITYVFSNPKFWNNIDPEITNIIQRNDSVQKKINSLRAEIETEKKLRVSALARVKELESIKSDPPPAPEKIETITVGISEFVPKLEYVSLWKNKILCDKIIGEYKEYVKADANVEYKRELIDGEYEAEMKTLRRDVLRLGKRWHLSIGPGVQVGSRGFGVGLTITYGWRIF